MDRQPVVILGMPRSGTSIVTRLLQDLGLFCGWHKDANNESLFFHRLNKWILHSAGVSVGNPTGIDALYSDLEIRRATIAYLDFMVNSPRFLLYTGPWRFLRHRTPDRIEYPWGWKDPANTLTFPLWAELFPEARVVHVIRHGVDVATSVLAFRATGVENDVSAAHRFRWIFTVRPKRSGFTNFPGCVDLASSFDLWRRYIARGDDIVRARASNAMTLRFEELALTPEKTLTNLARFCGLPTTQEQLDEVCASLRADRRFAYLDNEDLTRFAKDVESELLPWGYDAHGSNKSGDFGAKPDRSAAPD